MKIKGYVVEELPDSCGECQFLEVMMGDDETWCFCEITHDLMVHPHACGEYVLIYSQQANRARFIPTRVGNTPGSSARSGRAAVHPHACGEYKGRGFTARRVSRFIPTRVGNTFPICRMIFTVSVHPHACGEYSSLTILHGLLPCSTSLRLC